MYKIVRATKGKLIGKYLNFNELEPAIQALEIKYGKFQRETKDSKIQLRNSNFLLVIELCNEVK